MPFFTARPLLPLILNRPNLDSVRPPSWTIQADYTLRPAIAGFGRITSADRAGALARTLLLKFAHGEVRVLDIECDLPFVEIRRDPPEKADADFRIEVELRTDRLPPPGRVEGVLKIRTSDPTFPSIFVPVLAEIE